MNKIKLYLAFFLLFITGISTAQTTITLTPAKAFDYTNGVGVNIHLRFIPTVYFTGFDNIIYPKLKELGIKQVRDGVPYKDFIYAPDTLLIKNRFIKLYDSLGIKTSYLLDAEEVVDSPQLRDSAEYLSVFENSPALLNTVQYFEGFNEPDLTIHGWNPNNWDTLTYKIQQSMWNRVQSNDALAAKEVISPSFVDYWTDPPMPNSVAAISPHISNYFNLANFHTYDSGNEDADLFPGGYYDAMGAALDTIRRNKPWVVTEIGYENARYWNSPDSAGYQPYNYHYLSELAAAKYYSVLFMEMYYRGAKAVYPYEFIDQNTADQTESENNFGLLHTDGSEKPAFTVIKNTLHILKDTSTIFTTTPLKITLSGNTNGIKYLLYQKTDGRYYLALWQGRTTGVCYDITSFTDLPTDSQNVQVTFPFSFAKANIYQPLNSASPIYTFTNTDSLNINIPDNLLLIELDPVDTTSSQKNTFAIFPNPASNQLYFTTTQNNIEVFDVLGQRVLNNIETAKSISIQSLATGIYFIKTDNGVKEFMVTHY